MVLSPGAAADAGGGGVADGRGHACGARCTWTASRFLKSVGLGPFGWVGDEGREGERPKDDQTGGEGGTRSFFLSSRDYHPHSVNIHA
jgi:hypothetical protein